MGAALLSKQYYVQDIVGVVNKGLRERGVQGVVKGE